MLQTISSFIIPVILTVLGFLLLSDRKNYLDAFMEGAKNGLSITVSLIPSMVLIMTALSMLSVSGAIERLVSFGGNVFSLLGVPTEILPLILTRPFSGSAANAAFAKLLEETGADSFPAFAASLIMGSGDTFVYIISVYFSGAKHVKNTSYALPVALCAMIFSVFFCCFLARFFF